MAAERPLYELFAHWATDRPNDDALGEIVNGAIKWRTWGRVAYDVERLSRETKIAPNTLIVHQKANSYNWILQDLALAGFGGVHAPLHATSPAYQLPSILRRFNNREFTAPPDLFTVVFTSGTSAEPRGVMLSQANLVANAIALSEAVGGSRQEVRLSFLPFSHLYGRTADLYTWLVRGSKLVLAESRETIFRDLQIVMPTAISGVPYFYQKALDVAAQQKCSLPTLFGGHMKRCYSGGAAMAPAVEAAFTAAGLPVLSGYGLSEAAPVVTATRIEEPCDGAVGRPLPGIEVRLADDGELLVRGPNVMLGYFEDPAATAEVLRDGWLHTGDLAEQDSAGRLRIVGRKKELIALATGKKVFPSRVEALLCESPWIEQAAVLGEGEKCLRAVIVPNRERLKLFIRERRLWVWSKRRAVTHRDVRAHYAAEIAHCLADAAAEEQIGEFAILDRPFSIETGELTTKLSLRRNIIATHFPR